VNCEKKKNQEKSGTISLAISFRITVKACDKLKERKIN
jgi:hypothetical protein